MEKQLRSFHIIVFTGLSCLLFAFIVALPAIFGGGDRKGEDPAIEASILAELHLDRAMDEMIKTGICPEEGKTIRCSSDNGKATYTMETKVVRGKSGKAKRISVRVRWEAALGGGAIVATGICDGTAGIRQAAMGAAEPIMSEKLTYPEE